MAHNIYFQNIVDFNGEQHLTLTESDVHDVPAKLIIDKNAKRPLCLPNDPTLSSFHEPKTDDERNNSRRTTS